MDRLANFTRHYPRSGEVLYWKEKGFSVDATPRIPTFDLSWQERDIVESIKNEIIKIENQGYKGIIIGGLTNVMVYAWYIAQSYGLNVLHTRGRSTGSGYKIITHAQLLDASSLYLGYIAQN